MLNNGFPLHCRGNEVGEYVDAELLELDNSRADLSPQPVGLSASIRSWFMAMVAEEVERRHDAVRYR